MDPLSVSASVVGLLAAGLQVISLISRIKDAPQSLRDIKFEVKSLNIIIAGLQRFVQKTSSINRSRAALIPIQDVVTIVTQTVLVYSELDGAVKSWSGDNNLKARTKSALGRGDAAAALRLVNQLQRHKTSLSLVLQIIQCGSDLDALECSEALQGHTDQELERNTDLAERLQNVQVAEGTIEALSDSCAASSAVEEDINEKNDTRLPLSTDEALVTAEDKVEPVPDVDCSLQLTFEEVLAASRTYLRIRDLEADAISCISTIRSHGWSILSGISSSQVTRIGVICLPLHGAEIERFLNLALPQGRAIPRVTSSAAKTIQNRLHDMVQDLEGTGLIAGPIGDDLSHWQATIMGPGDTPYEGGIFFLAMHFPEEHPFKPPRVSFTTRIYHPNISNSGRISIAVRRNRWNPASTPAKLLLSIESLMRYPDMDDVVDNDKLGYITRTDNVLRLLRENGRGSMRYRRRTRDPCARAGITNCRLGL